ncbi:MAG: hypothetical protein H6741_01345 [Alphaproteobacteria bacterium]|nr:hypothetical protein [Alphaproteobacteria bacterium]
MSLLFLLGCSTEERVVVEGGEGALVLARHSKGFLASPENLRVSSGTELLIADAEGLVTLHPPEPGLLFPEARTWLIVSKPGMALFAGWLHEKNSAGPGAWEGERLSLPLSETPKAELSAFSRLKSELDGLCPGLGEARCAQLGAHVKERFEHIKERWPHLWDPEAARTPRPIRGGQVRVSDWSKGLGRGEKPQTTRAAQAVSLGGGRMAVIDQTDVEPRRLLILDPDNRILSELPLRQPLMYGALAPWQDGVVLYDDQQLLLVDRDGQERGRVPLEGLPSHADAPVTAVAPSVDAVQVLDDGYLVAFSGNCRKRKFIGSDGSCTGLLTTVVLRYDPQGRVLARLPLPDAVHIHAATLAPDGALWVFADWQGEPDPSATLLGLTVKDFMPRTLRRWPEGLSGAGEDVLSKVDGVVFTAQGPLAWAHQLQYWDVRGGPPRHPNQLVIQLDWTGEITEIRNPDEPELLQVEYELGQGAPGELLLMRPPGELDAGVDIVQLQLDQLPTWSPSSAEAP